MASERRTPLLEKSRWPLLKREENLKEEQRFRPRDLLRYNLKTVRAYLLQGGASATLGVQLARLGWKVSRPMAPSNHAVPHSADEGDRPFASPRLEIDYYFRAQELISGEENLKEEQRFWLRDLFRYYLKTVRAYLLQGGASATPGVQLARLGWKVSRPMAPSNHAFPHSADERDRPFVSPTPGTGLNYFRAQKLISSGIVGGREHQGRNSDVGAKPDNSPVCLCK